MKQVNDPLRDEVSALELLLSQTRLSFIETRKHLERTSEITLTKLDKIEQLLDKLAERIDALMWAVHD